MGLAVAFVALGLAVRSGPTGFDTALVAAVQAAATGLVRTVLDALTAVGQPIVWDPAVIALGVVLAMCGRMRDGLQLVAWVAVAEVAAEIAKILFDRVRPEGIAVSDFITQASYPSGHVARTVVTLGMLVLIGPSSTRSRWAGGLAVAAFSVLMGMARIESGEHWPTDVVGGLLLSGAVVSIAFAYRRLVPASSRPVSSLRR